MAASSRPEGAGTMGRGQLRLVREEVSGLLAHDLKSPLAAIAMNLDYALGELGPDAPAVVRGALEDCRESNHRAVEIVSDMVDALRLASGQQRATFGPVDVQARLAASVRRIAARAASRGVKVLWTAEPATVRGDAILLDRALERLLERALWHACRGGSIDVTLRGGNIVIRVASPEGPVSSPEPGATAQSLATHFADAVMRAQGGGVWTEGDADGALLFVVALPS
jgi:signal transduction histidine kinase